MQTMEIASVCKKIDKKVQFDLIEFATSQPFKFIKWVVKLLLTSL